MTSPAAVAAAAAAAADPRIHDEVHYAVTSRTNCSIYSDNAILSRFY